MTKKSFYLTLNIINILLCVYMYYVLAIFYLVFSIDNGGLIIICTILTTIFIKIFLLYILFKILKKCFTKFAFSKIVKELKTVKNAKKRSLLLALSYDIAIMILFIGIPPRGNMLDFSYNILPRIEAYEILSIGGVLIFYLSTFCLWIIEDKIKSFYNKKLLNNKSSK